MAAKLNFLAIFTFLALTLFFLVAPPTSSDTYWHLSVGREVWQTKKIPTNDTFVYGSKTTNYPSTEWLAGLIFYMFVHAFGNFGLPILRTILGIITIYVFYQTLKLITDNKFVLSASSLIVGYILGYRLFDRPESFSFVFIAVINYIFLKYYLTKRISKLIYLLPPIFLLWPNIHAYFALSLPTILLLGLLIIANRKNAEPQVKIATLLTIFIISFLALATRFKTILEFISHLGQISQLHVAEFDSLWRRIQTTHGFDIWHQIPWDIYIYILILVIYVSVTINLFFKWKENKLKILVAIYYLLFLLTPLKGVRMLSPVVLISFPFLIILSREIIEKYPRFISFISKTLIIILLYIFMVSIVNKDILGMKSFSFVTTYKQNGQGLDIPVAVVNHSWTEIFPINAENIINNYLDTKRIFTVNYWGNYFIWTVPKAKVFSDSMITYKTKEEWDDEDTLIYGLGGWEKILDKYGIDTVVNNQPSVFIQNHTPVYMLPDWKLIYVNNTYTIYAKESSIIKLPVDLSKIHLDIDSEQKFKDEDEKQAVSQLEQLKDFDPKNAFAREQLISYYLKNDIKKAEALAVESRTIIPKNPFFSLYIAEIAKQKNRCIQAKEFANEAKDKSFGNFSIMLQVKQIVQQCLK